MQIAPPDQQARVGSHTSPQARELGPDHPTTLAAKSALAAALRQSGDAPEAVRAPPGTAGGRGAECAVRGDRLEICVPYFSARRGREYKKRDV